MPIGFRGRCGGDRSVSSNSSRDLAAFVRGVELRAPDFDAELWLAALFVLLPVRARLGGFCRCGGGRWGCHGVFFFQETTWFRFRLFSETGQWTGQQ